MKLVIFGLTISSSWGNGHATVWRALTGALIKRGHRVVFFERDVPYYAGNRDLAVLPGGELVLYASWADARAQAQRHLAEADVGLVTSYCPDGVAATELLLATAGPLRAFYDLDTPVTLAQLRAGQTLSYIGPRGLGDFDIVFSFTGGAALRELRQQLGARRVVPLYGCVDPALHRPVPAEDQFAADLSYLGTYAADRQPMLQELFIEPARRCRQLRFLIGGAQYPADFPWTENIYFVRHMPPARHPAFFCSSQFTLNITRRAMAGKGYCPSGRLFEAAACGVPILSDWWEGLAEFFAPGTEILVVRTTADVLASFELSQAERTQIARAARERTLAQHSAERRAVELEHALASARQPMEVTSCGE